jgi:diacylglycerol kinase (ATP)
MTSVVVVANTEKISRKDLRELRGALAGAGVDDVECVEIERGSDAKKGAAKAVKRGAQTVVVCGGDGSVRAAAEALIGSSTSLAVVPCGTANLFVAGLSLPTDIDDVAKAVAIGDRRTIDTGLCNGRTFNVMAGSGFDVGMLAKAEDDKDRLGTIAYVRSGIDEVRHRKLFDAKVTIDGTTFHDGPTSCVLVGKLGSLKGGIKTFPEATPTDGLLHVAVVTAAGAREWVSLMVSAALRRQRSSGQVDIGQGAAVCVDFGKKRRFELDGGVKGKAKKLDFEVNPNSLSVCAPQS